MQGLVYNLKKARDELPQETENTGLGLSANKQDK